jgi:asparagine synthase (glutamine-hydrolysing)
MCGIAGIVRWGDKPVSRQEIEGMTQQIAHRGPDGEGYWVCNPVALGHRRLALIDIAGGKQPMSTPDEKLWIIYNGELYNYLELRGELQNLGHRFTTNSDTEVVVHAYQEWGDECVRRFRGMYAFAIADHVQERLYLARDHFGIKPLYYRVNSQFVAFASELAALRRVDAAVSKGNLQAVEYFLRYQYIPTPHTIYKDVFKLPPAHYMIVDFDSTYHAPVKYWEMTFNPQTDGTDEEWQEKTLDLIYDSVKAHLISEVPFGVFLSGGIDSTLVAAQMSRILQQPVKAFSIGFDDPAYTELEYAKQAAERYGVELYTEIVDANSLHMLPDLIAHYGEPYGDSSAIPAWHVSRLARQHVTMVLSGDGGDEGFAGYPTYALWMQPPASPTTIPMTLRRAAKNIYRRVIPDDYPLRDWQYRIMYYRTHQRRKLWRSEYHTLIGRPNDLFAKASLHARGFEQLSYAQYLDYQTYLPCDILTKMDVAAMYHGLEVRTPLVDVRVFEQIISRLPVEQRLRQNGGGSLTGKYLLKQLLLHDFPHEFIYRKKQGFSIPRDRWFLPGGSGREYLEAALADNHSRLTAWFNPQEIRALLDNHSAAHDNSGLLWLLLVLSIWLQQNPTVEFS